MPRFLLSAGARSRQMKVKCGPCMRSVAPGVAAPLCLLCRWPCAAHAGDIPGLTHPNGVSPLSRGWWLVGGTKALECSMHEVCADACAALHCTGRLSIGTSGRIAGNTLRGRCTCCCLPVLQVCQAHCCGRLLCRGKKAVLGPRARLLPPTSCPNMQALFGPAPPVLPPAAASRLAAPRLLPRPLPCPAWFPFACGADRFCSGPRPQGRRPHAQAGAGDHLPTALCRHSLQRQCALGCPPHVPCWAASARRIPCWPCSPRCRRCRQKLSRTPCCIPCSTCCTPRPSTAASWTGARSTWLCGTRQGCRPTQRTRLSEIP